MKEKGGKGNAGMKLFRLLVEARWFFAVSASCVATIIGITLTFGINSCRENNRVRHEMEKSMLQAADNISERFGDASEWLTVIENQNRVYRTADSLYSAGAQLSDSLCLEFRGTMPFIKISAFDHEFEKIFRGSYQIWQLQNRNDSLAFYIGQCYDGLNTVEATCENLTEGMLEQIGIVNATKGFYRMSPREWTLTLLADPQFQYYMTVRRVKTAIASEILKMALQDYETNVLPRTRRLSE